MGRCFPIGKPTPFAADDVQERISYRTKAATQITSELLRAENGNRVQNPVVCPTVVLVEQLNVVLSHDERVSALSLGNPTPHRHSVKTERGISGELGDRPEWRAILHDQIREELPTTRPELLFCWAQPLAYRLLAAGAVSPGAAAPISPAKCWGHCPVTRRNDSLYRPIQQAARSTLAMGQEGVGLNNLLSLACCFSRSAPDCPA